LGHATHFLSRLERAEQNHTERAMELYHNPKLGKWLLEQLHLSEHHERFALSLDEEDKGPFLVMSRTGGFVTCLGKGMSTKSLYMVRYERYQVLRQRALDLLENIEDFKENEEDSVVAKALHMLSERGCFLERERFEELAALYLILRIPFMVHLLRVQDLIADSLKTFTLTKCSPKSRKHKALTKLYWQSHQELGHLLLLCFLQGEQGYTTFLRKLDDGSDRPHELYVLLWTGALSGELSLILRALWGLGRLGKSVWPTLKQKLRDNKLYSVEWRFVLMGSLVLAVRHRALRHEISKELLNKKLLTSPQMHAFYRECLRDEPDPEKSKHDPESGPQDGLETWMTHFGLVLKEPEIAQELAEIFVQHQAYAWMLELELTPPSDSSETLPIQQAYSFITNTPLNIKNDSGTWFLITMLTTWLAQSEARDFYLPRELSQKLDYKSQQKEATRLWKAHIEEFSEKTTKKQKKTKITPNEPCPCNSGKKYKRCCRRKSKK